MREEKTVATEIEPKREKRRRRRSGSSSGRPKERDDRSVDGDIEAGGRKETWASRLIFFLLAAMLVFSALAYGTVHSWAVGVLLFVAALLLLLWTLDAWRTGLFVISRSWLQLPLCAFVLLGLVQLLPFGGADFNQTLTEVGASRAISRDPFVTRFAIIQFAGLLVYFACALVYLGRRERWRKLVWTIITFGLLFAVFGFFQAALSPTAIYWTREFTYAHPFASFVNGHHFATYMLMTAGLGMGLLATRALRREQLIYVGFAVFVMCIALVITAARGAFISLLAELLFVALFASVARRRQVDKNRLEDETNDGNAAQRASLLKRAGIVTLAVVLIYGGVWGIGGAASFEKFLGIVNSTNPTSGRAEYWRAAWQMFQDHPLLGVGLGAFSVVYTQYDPSNGALRTDQAHNDYLELLCVGGIIGALIGVWFIVGLFRKSVARLQTDDPFRRGTVLGALAGCFAALLHSFVDFPLHALANALLFLMLAALATGDFEEQRAK